MAECLFCKIVDRQLESDIVRESQAVLAFRDINPAAPTHVLVIPKQHISSVAELSDAHRDVLAEIFDTLASIAQDEGLDGGWRVVTNVGPQAGQSVPHLHFHLIGGRPMSWPPG